MYLSSLHIEIDKIDNDSWDNLINQFDDASLYQTRAYEVSAGNRTRVSHIVVKDGEEIVGCCHASLRKIPFCNIGIADIKWGPLCMKKGKDFDPGILNHLVRGIKEEYAIKRGCLLRLVPNARGECKEALKKILEREGFERNESVRPYRTFMLDLSPSLDDLRKNLLQKWRNCLNKAERKELNVLEGTSDELFKTSIILAKDMGRRKNLYTVADYFEKHRSIQKDLPDPIKMKIMVCEMDNEPVSTVVFSAVGDTGIYLLGATGQKGLTLKLNTAYLLQWRMIKWLKENGFRYYDLGAFNPKLNPSVYHFKKGIAGKKECEETFLGEFYGCFNLSGRMMKFLIDCKKIIRIT